MSVAGSTECRLSSPCPDWNDGVVNAATAALHGNASDDVDTLYALNAFATHYSRQSLQPPECVALYDRVAVKLSVYYAAVAGGRPRVLLATAVAVFDMTCLYNLH